MNKKLNELTEKEYKVLNDLGMLFELFPTASGSWYNDCNKIPEPLRVINWDNILQSLNEHLEEVRRSGNDCEDDVHYLYEGILTTVYGEDVFKWINKQ